LQQNRLVQTRRRAQGNELPGGNASAAKALTDPASSPEETHFAAGGIKRTAEGEPKKPINIDASLADLVIEPVKGKTSRLFNELIDRYHYLDYTRMGGAQMRFFVKAGEHLAALWAFRRRPGG
jgi:hypothetical protein